MPTHAMVCRFPFSGSYVQFAIQYRRLDQITGTVEARLWKCCPGWPSDIAFSSASVGRERDSMVYL